MKLHLVSLGCARNLTDSEVILGRLQKAGHDIIKDAALAEVIIINTCSFIEQAIDESIDTILELSKYKISGVCRRLIVAGCLPERFGEKIVESLPEVDFFLGTGALDKIVHTVEKPLNATKCFLPDPNLTTFSEKNIIKVNTYPHIAYIKISEGCNSHCTYCIIPKLRGRQKSRPIQDIVNEARNLVASGIKELILVAQDTTSYGTDFAFSCDLARLLKSIADISDSIWIRVLYGHPESINDNIINTVVSHQNICSYFDIPVQHISKNILQKMGRKYTRYDMYKLFGKIRGYAANSVLRTTVIVGFPGETDNDFNELLQFVKDIDFDHLGCFIYSDSFDLPSHNLPDHVPLHIAQQRYDQIMSSQMEISRTNNKKHIDKTFKVLIEEQSDNNTYTGRTYFQAPDVDGITYINSADLQINSFANVKITDAFEYDLKGEMK